MSREDARGQEDHELRKRDRFLRDAVLQERLQARAEVHGLEALIRCRDLIGAPPAMAAGPAAFALVESGRIDLGRAGAAEEEPLLVQYVLAAPAHAALALPHPVDGPFDHDSGLL